MGEAQQESFENLSLALTTAPVLTIAYETDPFILDTDTYGVAVGRSCYKLEMGRKGQAVPCHKSKDDTVLPDWNCLPW